jgi:predicted secreted protein
MQVSRYAEFVKKFLLIGFLGLSLAQAGDIAHFDLIGFSSNGKYLAFRQAAIGDGTGFPYAGIDVIDVAKNTLIASSNMDTQTDNASTAAVRAAVLTKAAPLLKKYGIQVGNQGRFVAGALGGAQGAVMDNTLEFNAKGNAYRLELSMRDGGQESECNGHAPQLLKVMLLGKVARVLQNDTKLPSSRRCAADYRMHSVFVYGSSLVVFVSVSTDGFEGSNVRFMAVTAKL